MNHSKQTVVTSIPHSNAHAATVAGFGDEWSRFDQSNLSSKERQEIFADYFGIFPWKDLPARSEGADFGCGSGRWAAVVAPMVGRLHCVDASGQALDVARRNLTQFDNVDFMLASVAEAPIADSSLDFGYSLGVLHHVPDTQQGLASCVAKLKVGAPFLLYLYYRFDDRPLWFRTIWKASDLARRVVSKMPHGLRYVMSQIAALGIYWPLARGSALLERIGHNVSSMPLSYYRDKSFYTMRTDALDRFGTRLEQRFTKAEMQALMTTAGLEHIKFSKRAPFWCAVGRRA